MGKFDMHDFYCTKCGNRSFELPRIRAKRREKLHLKKIYCIHCKKEVNFCEIANPQEKSEFLLEFNYHNYDEEGNRILPFGEFKNKLIKEGIDISQFSEF